MTLFGFTYHGWKVAEGVTDGRGLSVVMSKERLTAECI